MRQLCHHLTFKLLSLLPPGMEHYVHDLLSTVVFHPTLQWCVCVCVCVHVLVELSTLCCIHFVSVCPSSFPSPSFPLSPLLRCIQRSSFLSTRQVHKHFVSERPTSPHHPFPLHPFSLHPCSSHRVPEFATFFSECVPTGHGEGRGVLKTEAV